jgi:hypothetical protein
MNDQDSHCHPEANVCRFTLHRQGQNPRSSTRSRAIACRALTLVMPHGAALGYRPTDLGVSPCPDRAKGLLPARHARASTLGEIR